MDKEEIFTTVVNHLYAQGHRATFGQNGNCAYRGNNNDKCAAGILIPDELYTPEMEGRLFDELTGKKQFSSECISDELRKKLGRLAEMFGEHTALILSLQSVHDDAKCWGPKGLNFFGKSRLYQIARDNEMSTWTSKYNLDPTEAERAL